LRRKKEEGRKKWEEVDGRKVRILDMTRTRHEREKQQRK